MFMLMTGSHAFPVRISFPCRGFDSHVCCTTISYNLGRQCWILHPIFVSHKHIPNAELNAGEFHGSRRRIKINVIIKLEKFYLQYKAKRVREHSWDNNDVWWNPYMKDKLLSLIRGKLIITRCFIHNSYIS